MHNRGRGNPRIPRSRDGYDWRRHRDIDTEMSRGGMPRYVGNRPEVHGNSNSRGRSIYSGHRPGVYGSQNLLTEPRDEDRMRFNVASPHNFDFRRNRTASTSSDQSYQRRNNPHFRFNQETDMSRNDRQSRSMSRFKNTTETSGENNSFSGRRKCRFGFKALESLLEKDPEDLLMEMSNGKKGIAEFIENNLSEDGIVLLVKILSKGCESSFDDTKHKVLQTYLNETFINKLVKYTVFLPMQNKMDQMKNKYFWNDPDEFWYNLIKICQSISDSLPTFSIQVLPDILKTLIICFQNFENVHNRHISDEIKESVQTMNDVIQALLKDKEEKQKNNLKRKLAGEDNEEPPDDFRQISLYPSTYELLSTNHGFLRKNVVEGSYRDVNHYLDVQFRLLREDFVGPLRTGINNYRSNEKKRLENVRIHKNVIFLNPETVNEQYCIRLCFDSSKKKKNFKYENSRRFMFGSLLCFTQDNFKTIIFGKVAERKVEDLQKSELVVGFDQNTTVFYDRNYLMVESSVYFEPYYHVLHVLQNMSTENFPMEKYIIHVDKNVQPPQYLLPGSTYNICGYEFLPLMNWPKTNFYKFNDSQLTAFEAALTQEFCIIQGPPGTGKTYLGLKIAKTLLENHRFWYKKTPMLVICYTNHALDQFLEGIANFTNKILRVGGQSKNENLKAYNLRNRSRFKLSPALLQQRHSVQVILGQIKNITENLKHIEQYNSVRAFDVFEDVVPHVSGTWFRTAKRQDILNWLLAGAENAKRSNGDPQDSVQGQQEQNQLEENGDEDVDSSEDDDEENPDENINVQVQDDIFDEVNVMHVQCSTPLITIESLRMNIVVIRDTLERLRQNQNPTVEEMIEEQERSFELYKLENHLDYLNLKLVEGKQRSLLRTELPGNANLLNPHNMSPDDRWNLYFHWLNLYKQKLLEKLDLLNKEFRDEFRVYEDMRDLENTNSMKDVLVVGMTTTGAARLRSSLQALKSPVVIVEEAAEVLEAHIVSSLTKHCKHLILIGDHQQLKPSTANYRIERFYNLGISLFERMVINKIQLYSLNVQHRMKPEISSLISPTIYPNLENAPSVNERPPITGIDNCLFFIDHSHREAECEGTSKKNHHEAEFLIYLARHLVLNGYKPENITILAAYLGQMFEIQKLRKNHKHILENIRIAVLDNYQGEESDIILLSLVRNNNENKIGFLSIENRVCVALSRARNGFYLMGNMAQLCAASDKLWSEIRRTFEQQNAIGNKLSLRCQVHPDTITEVEKAEDFLKISEGGCNQKCGATLVCGHKCTSLCHVLDRDHIAYRCRERCGKNLCENNPLHVCRKMCFEECGPCIYKVQRNLPCGHIVNLVCHVDPDTYNCIEPVSTVLPCGHTADKPCHRNPETFRCRHPCEVKVEPCGHACELTCHIRHDPDHLQYKCKKKCARYRKGCTVETENHLCRKFCFEECEPCELPVRKKRTVCPHAYDVPCNLDVDELECKKPCGKALLCGHKCKSKCNEPCGTCQAKVEKINPICKHPIKVKCCDEPDRKLCNRKCPLTLPCGHPCTKRCNEPCTTSCRIKVKTELKSPCGHTITEIKCSIATSIVGDGSNTETLLKYCNHPCRDQLKCEHECTGTCGECHQGRVHKKCSQNCGFPLVCNHPCEFPCRQACRPCGRPCPYKCKHGSRIVACSKKCGDVCTPCKEKCPRKCEHQECTKFCGDICNVVPCERPCKQRLICGHKCIGFCGDPCPSKCLICDKEELTVIFFGYEEEENARFVLLEDCGHVFESIGLEQWMNQNAEQISFKECPQCKTPIKTTRRYSNLIKQAMADVAKVKMNFHGSSKEIAEKRKVLQEKLLLLKLKYERVLRIYCAQMGNILDIIEKRLKVEAKGKRQPINKIELNALESKLQIIEHVIDICSNLKTNPENACQLVLKQVNFVVETLTPDEDYITDQEIDDIHFELNRLSRMVDYEKIRRSQNFPFHFSNNITVKRLDVAVKNLIASSNKFVERNEQEVIQLLKDLSKAVASGIGISDQERREIVRAMGFKQGHWYKCPNGHPYTIGDCGGAMVEAKCFCGAIIGGRSHTLRSDNAVATEMDGARHGAWSEAANMANYQFNF